MTNKAQHLIFIQNIISRMAACSFSVKTWTMVLFSVGVSVLYISSKMTPEMLLALMGCIVVLIWSMWALDAFFLAQERLFRALYNENIKKEESQIDFSMDIRPYMKTPANSARACFRSKTLVQFYLPFVLVMAALAVVLVWGL